MKTAVMILAHDQPRHLVKLVQKLYCQWIHIYIHVDKKQNIEYFKEFVAEDERITYIKEYDRKKIKWGGFSIVEATLTLLQYALQDKEFHYTRFCLLSGSDYPIKSLEDIRSRFDSKQEFIRIDRKLDVFCEYEYYKKIKYYHFFDNLPKKICMNFPKINRKQNGTIELYHGSQWWSLTRESIEYIMEFIQKNKDYVKYFKYTFCSDEIFFHSIVKNSQYAKNIVHDFQNENDLRSFYLSNDHGSHYIDWNSKGVASLPKILDESDFNAIINSNAFFARKFKELKSDGLIKLLSIENCK